MGPIALFDKSFLQGLTVDESVWFDRFFLANVCPLFYVETLGDLEKRVREGRTPEEEVGLIAEKFPEMSGSPNAFHGDLCVASLIGQRVAMTGQIVLSGGRAVKVNGERGIVFDQFPEAEAFNRWQKREFLEIERLHAKAWRERLSGVNLAETRKRLGAMGSCKSLREAKMLAERVLTSEYVPIELMKFILLFLNIGWEHNEEIFKRWRRASFPPLSRHAPYAAYVLTVELFFHAALASSLISSGRPSNRADVAYLYYLPFCQLFVSSDRLHQRCAPLFLRDDQEFVWGLDLKEGLGACRRTLFFGKGVVTFFCGGGIMR